MSSHFAFSNALSLMTTAAGHGDIEEMGDQMSRRKDRLIHPAGEGYGGYCVPKDGLFLEFVLTLQRGEKLRQIGLSEDQHSDAVKWANEALEKRNDFSTDFEWEQWCRENLQENMYKMRLLLILLKICHEISLILKYIVILIFRS